MPLDEVGTCPPSCPETPPATPAPAPAPPSVSNRRMLVDCEGKLAFLQMVLGFRGSARAALEAPSTRRAAALQQRWGESRRGGSVVGAASGPEQVWLWVQEPKDHSGGMQGLSDTPNSVNKKGMSNVLINLATTKGMKETAK